MARTGLSLGIAALVCLAAPDLLRCQTVDGVLIDAQSGRPVPAARMLLMDTADVVHDSTTSDRGGRFVLTARGAGTYVISVEREAYATVMSGGLPLELDRTVSYTMEAPPLSIANMTQIRETMDRSERLRAGVVPLCRGRMNPVEGGILMGVVRARRSREPVEGARASISHPDSSEPVPVAITDPHGVYLFCFVAQGDAVRVTVEAEGFQPAAQDVEVRPGTISWYDFAMRPSGGPR